MEIILGKTSGFCFGVANTVKRAYGELTNSNENVYCLGEIVHNERVVEELSQKGMIFVKNIDEVPNNSKLIIRAHGEPKQTYEKAQIKNIELLDLTCGKIKVIRSKIEKAKEDAFVILIGKKNHPETIGTISFAKYGQIVEEKDDIVNLEQIIKNSGLKRIKVLSQTTFSKEKFNTLSNEIINSFPNYEIDIDNTICDATSERQEETKEIAQNVDVMIVIGGKNSSNTKELYNVANKYCQNVIMIQDVSDIDIELKSDYKVGVIAGASTSEKSIEEVIDFLHENKENTK